MKKLTLSVTISSILLSSLLTGCSKSTEKIGKIKLKETEYAVMENISSDSMENKVSNSSDDEVNSTEMSDANIITIEGEIIADSKNIDSKNMDVGSKPITSTTTPPTEQPKTEATITSPTKETATEATTTSPTKETATEATTQSITINPTTVEANETATQKEVPTTVQPVTEEVQNNSKDMHYGKATFYGAGPGGCCNLDDFENKYYTVAMNRVDYNNYNLAGAYLEVTDKDGDKVKVMVTNELPEGNSGDLDLSISAFESIEPLVTGIMNVSWKIIPLPTNEPIYYKYKPDSSQWWLEVQIRNQRYPIKTVECKDENGNWITLERKHYNYYCAPRGIGHDGPYTFRVTDMYGHELIDENIPLNRNQQCIPGGGNFPY